jgi:hypothetical protein
MIPTLTILLGLIVIVTSPAIAVDPGGERVFFESARQQGEIRHDIPVRSRDCGVRADTTWYGDYQVIGGECYVLSSLSMPAVMWTFDGGNGPVSPPSPLIPHGQGWSAHDMTANLTEVSRLATTSLR